ncbi:MAG: 4Fe-4S double cluster binding domain-containing protein [Thermoanaerobaculaceae bacterium]|jgi:epoxyqueuosine reductase
MTSAQPAGANGPLSGVPFVHSVVPATRRDDLRQEIEGAHEAGLLSDLIFRSYRRIFDCPLPDACAGARSLIVGALPHPQSRVAFTWRGSRFTVLVPPSYIRHWQLTRQAEDTLNERLAPLGHWARFARVPQKALTVHSGLALYGRNNIVYVPGLGSFHMLVSYYSSLPCEEESWLKPRLLERCERCTACRRACPTGAIPEDRTALRQERCITFYSGYSGPQELPAWFDPDWIECLVGCRRCQIVCPENRPFRKWVEDDWEFSEEETSLLLDGLTGATLPDPIRAKLDAMGLIEFFGLEECLQMLSRKLAILTARH